MILITQNDALQSLDLDHFKMKRIKQFVSLCVVAGLGIVLGGCRPSVREVVNVINTVPLGASRDQLRIVLVEKYKKRFPNWQDAYGLTTPPRTVTPAILKSDKELVSFLKSEHRYVRVFPSDLYSKIPPGAFTEPIGIVAESSEGNGSVSIYYDAKTNYIGFLAFTSGMDH
jgi:hypothetical protein